MGRYISLERLIEENKDRYYETLEQSSQGWHESKHDPWPYINYMLSILKMAYREFVERVGETKAPRGSKTDLVLAAISRFAGEFTVSQLEQACPGVSRDMIRRVLREQQGATSVNAKAVGLRHGGKRRCVPFSKGNKEGNRGQAQQNFSVR